MVVYVWASKKALLLLGSLLDLLCLFFNVVEVGLISGIIADARFAQFWLLESEVRVFRLAFVRVFAKRMVLIVAHWTLLSWQYIGR